MKTFYLTIPAIALLAACGGSSTSGGNAPQFTTIGGALDELELFIDEAERLDLTPIANIPTSGTASYDGVFSFGRIFERFPGDPDPQLDNPLIGEVALDVNFASNAMTGLADNFFSLDGAVSGQLAITDGEIVREDDEVAWVADVGGALPINGLQRNIEGVVGGTFAGDDAQFVGGLFIGTAGDDTALIGSVFAEQ